MAGFKRELRPGVWELRVYLGHDPVTGRKRWKSRSFHGGSRAVDKALAAFVTEQSDQRPSTTQTVSWLLEEYARLLVQLGRSPTTLRTYGSYIATWLKPVLGSMPLDRLTAGDVRALEAKMTAAGLSPSSIRQAHAILQGALRFAEEHEWVERNVAAIVRPPRQQRTTVTAPSIEEVELLYTEAGPEGSDLATAIALGALLGRRLGELCALRWSDVDLDAGTVRIAASAYTVKGGDAAVKGTKTHQVATLPAGQLAMLRFQDRRRWQQQRADRVGCALVADPFVLSRHSDGSGPPRPDSYSAGFGQLRDRLAMPHVHFHSLRHWHGTYLVDQGVDLVTVARRLGHADTTMIATTYGHGTERADRAAANVGGSLLTLEGGRDKTAGQAIRQNRPGGAGTAPE